MLRKICLKSDEEHPEQQYLRLIQDIVKHGSKEISRNGEVLAVIGSSMHFSLSDGIIPLLTTKKVAWKTCLKELLWMIKGQTDNRVLTQQNCHIWSGNASRSFLDSRGLYDLSENDLGPIYGHQWRHFNAPYSTSQENYDGKGVDQLALLIESLKDPKSRSSRRMVMSAWNPCQINEMALPPCHILTQFNVTNGNQLSCCMYQRSGDVGLGVPFNIASYSFLTHLLAKHCGLVAHEFIYTIGNAHIYDDHVKSLLQQVQRDPFPFPHISIKEKRDDISEYCLEDFIVSDYKYHSAIKMDMRV